MKKIKKLSDINILNADTLKQGSEKNFNYVALIDYAGTAKALGFDSVVKHLTKNSELKNLFLIDLAEDGSFKKLCISKFYKENNLHRATMQSYSFDYVATAS